MVSLQDAKTRAKDNPFKIILALIAVGIVISGAMSISKTNINIKDPSMIILLSLVGAFALVSFRAAYVSKYKKKPKTSRGDSARKTSTSAPKVEQVQPPRRSGSKGKKGRSPRKSPTYQGLLAQDLASKIVVHDDDSDMNSAI